jgi:hypothetical protein
MIVGYARVSTREQDLSGQLAELRAAGCAKVYSEKASGARGDADAFSGHGLRSGLLTSAAARGASLFKMMDVSRHKSVDVLRGYVRDADAFRDHAGAGLL